MVHFNEVAANHLTCVDTQFITLLLCKLFPTGQLKKIKLMAMCHRVVLAANWIFTVLNIFFCKIKLLPPTITTLVYNNKYQDFG